MKIFLFVSLVSVSALLPQESHRPKVGLVLSGGGALGFAHIGALRLIDSLGIPIDYIAGTSFGGLLGGLYAVGYRSDSLQRIVEDVEWSELFNDTPRRSILPYSEKKYSGRYYVRLPLKGFTPTPPSGAIAGQKISLLFNRLTRHYSDVVDFDSLPIPFRCVGVDLLTGNEVVIDRGPLSRAMRATMAIPSAFTPVEYGDSLLSDGGLLNNYPVDVLKAMGAEIIIGVDVSGYKFTRNDAKELFKVLDRAAMIPRYQKLNRSIRETDIYIEPQLDGFGITDFNVENIRTITERGYHAALLQRDRLIALKERLEQTSGHRTTTPPAPVVRDRFIVHGVQITGMEKLDFSFIYSLLGITIGAEITREQIEQRIDEVYALGYFETITYTTETVHDTLANIQFTVKEKSFRELNIGFRYDDFYQLVGVIGVRSTNTLLSGVRFESELEFAGLFRTWAKLSYPSRSLDQPVYPFLTLRYKDLPLHFHHPAVRLDYKDRSLSFGAGIGFTIDKSWSVEMEVDDEETSVIPVTVTTGPTLSHHLRYGQLNITLDYLDDVLLPRSGTSVISQLEFSSRAIGSDFDYTRFSLRSDNFFTTDQRHTVRIGVSFYRVFDSPPMYKQIVIGGPEEFIGADYLGIFGTKFLINRLEYRYEYKRDIFVKGIVNALIDPDIVNPLKGSPAPVKFGAGAGVMFTSILGPLELLVAYGERSYQASRGKELLFHFSAGMKF